MILVFVHAYFYIDANLQDKQGKSYAIQGSCCGNYLFSFEEQLHYQLANTRRFDDYDHKLWEINCQLANIQGGCRAKIEFNTYLSFSQ